MHRYTKLALGGFLTSVGCMILFDSVAAITGEMVPFVFIIAMWVLGLCCTVMRGFVWYRMDLAERTLEQLNEIEQSELSESTDNLN